ncbi:HlyD family secretion protein [Massilia sp. CCM 9210]|uniref:HlyD family secretion protein n=1 Tax=Massilia scottii TaxID=3057166 RepID=UPI002796AA39|nr:HlyD family secretion protein [Massilia sp. CCM 9210]MDQ1815430.1 HlyD family secretion protein [Massilia sp. CCM 9210]
MTNPLPPSRSEPPADDANPPVPGDSSSTTIPIPPAAAPATPAAPDTPPKYIKPKTWTVVLMAVVALIGIVLIMWAWRLGPFNSTLVQTDNGYVRGQITVLAPQVNGYVAEVLVKDFQFVKAGQPLLRIDDRIYKARVDQAEAQRDGALAALENFTQTQAQNRARGGAARATLVAVQAERNRAAAELGRVEELAAKGSVSLNERDRVRMTTQLAGANVLKAKADIAIAEETVKATTVSRGGLEAQVKTAEAQLALAKIDLSNTVVKAPRDGQVSEASVRLGQYVTAGSQLLFLVPDTMWIVANFKENQTWKMRIGQRATFTVDAFNGAALSGHVEQIAPATGSEFSVLRADNASGNFTKVVQRLPVRIAIDANQELARRLRPGMSVIVKVDTVGAAEQQP